MGVHTTKTVSARNVCKLIGRPLVKIRVGQWAPIWNDLKLLFDDGWYRRQYGRAGTRGLLQYLNAGWKDGRNPSPLFNTGWYLEQYPDVAASGLNPLVHYIRHGAEEGRDPHPRFSTRYYLDANADVARSGMNPLAHYMQYGMAEGRCPTPPVQQDSGSQLTVEMIDALRVEVHAIRDTMFQETRRLDYGLGLAEGVLDIVGDLEQARSTDAFQAPFERGNPLVTVCVATCNRASLLLDRCLRSLLAQSYRNLQIVVVGDHCTDDTGYRLAQLHDERIVFENLPQRGPYPSVPLDRWRVAGSNAMNRALDLAEGDFIAHLDDDDSATFDRIEAMLEHAQRNNAEFCWHPFWHERADGTWRRLGNGIFMHGQMTTGSTFYHRYYARIKWDLNAYRSGEPGDWNRLRKIRLLRPTTAFLDRPLMFHHREMNQGPLVPQLGETFLN